MTKYLVVCPSCGSQCYWSYAEPAKGALMYMDGRPVKPKDKLICESCKYHIHIPREEDNV